MKPGCVATKPEDGKTRKERDDLKIFRALRVFGKGWFFVAQVFESKALVGVFVALGFRDLGLRFWCFGAWGSWFYDWKPKP